MSSAEYTCKLFKPIFAYRQTVWTLIRLLLVWSGSTLFAKMTFKITSRWQSRRQLMWHTNKVLYLHLRNIVVNVILLFFFFFCLFVLFCSCLICEWRSPTQTVCSATCRVEIFGLSTASSVGSSFYCVGEQRRFWPDCADAQAGLVCAVHIY